MRFSSKDAALVPVMAVASAMGHMAVGPLISRTLHLPGPTIAGTLIVAPLLIAGALTLKRGIILLTSTLNGIILSAFVPIGLLAIPIYFVVGAVLEIFCIRTSSATFQPMRLSLAGGIVNAISIVLIGLVGFGMRNFTVLSVACTIGFVTGALGGTLAAKVASRVMEMFPRNRSGNTDCLD